MSPPTGSNERRRTVLRALGGSVVAALAGCQGRAQPGKANDENTPESSAQTSGDKEQPTESPFDYDEIITATVEEGVTELTEQLQELSSGTMLHVPPGTYSLEGHVELESLENVAIIGDDAVIRPTIPVEEFSGYVLTLRGKNIHFQGFTFDFSKPGFGGRIQCLSSGDFICRDVTVRGRNDGRGTFRWDVRDPDGTGLVENVNAPDGGPETFGMFVGKAHAGELFVRDCHIEGFYNNGLYASSPGLDDGGHGPVKVEGGLYKNNNVAGVRLGSRGSYVKGATVVVDDEVPPTPDGTINSRGIRLRDQEGLLVEDCEVRMGTEARGDGAIVIESSTGSATISRTKITVDSDSVPAIRAKSPETVGANTATQIDCIDVDIVGKAGKGDTILVVDRDRCRFENLSVRQTGMGRNGLHLIRSKDIQLLSSRIDVTGKPLVLDFSSISKQSTDLHARVAEKPE